MKHITVSELNNYIKVSFANDKFLQSVTLKGQVSNFTNHVKTGHLYFTLKDDQGSIRAIMFKPYASKLKFNVANGQEVVVTGSVQVYVRDGLYQIYCTTMEPFGIGALHLAFEQLKERLYKQGLFNNEHKKTLPLYPQRIGVISSRTSAAMADILNVLSRRYPIAQVVIFDSLVQGDTALSSVVTALEKAQNTDVDVIIIARGGGSIEDLWTFNEEQLAKRIFDCSKPIITGIGHEIDYTIADFVADRRAPTPSAAAELSTPDIKELALALKAKKQRLDYSIKRAYSANNERLSRVRLSLNTVMTKRINDTQTAVSYLSRRLQRAVTVEAVEEKQRYVLSYKARLDKAVDRYLESRYNLLQNKIEKVEGLSPLKILSRGYSITQKEGKAVTAVSDVSTGDVITTRLHGGEIRSTVL